MLETLRKGPGFRSALAFALIAALCLAAPPAAIAMGHGEATMHCLSKAGTPTHGKPAAAADAHHGGTHHGGNDNRDEHRSGDAPGCCGLFCLSAVLPPSEPALSGLMLPRMLAPERVAHLSGRVPELPDRPPISISSL